ncbi:MAG: 8-oxo-dGTP diphosphatase [Verrucomicrobiota bacterium]
MPETDVRRVDDVDWETWEAEVRANLLFIIQDGRILLIRKKRGLGAGNINGPGGKVDPGETVLEAALREVEEEVGVVAHTPEEMGVLYFQFTDGFSMHCTVFRSPGYDGELIETDEAIPMWFGVDEIPFEEMWEDDRHWLPEMIEGRKFDAYFVFEDKRMLSKRLEWR